MVEIVPAAQRSSALIVAVQNARRDFEAQLPAFLKSPKIQERMFSLLLRALQDDTIARATPDSVIASVLKSAQWGIPLDGTHGALVAYFDSKKQASICQFIPMYRGMLSRVRDSGKIGPVNCELVFSFDRFSHTLGSERKLVHVPGDGNRTDFSLVTRAYSTMRWLDKRGRPVGITDFEIMSRDEIDGIQARVKAKGPMTPWVTAWGEQAKKTVLRRHCKRAPIGQDLAVLIDDNERDELGIEEPRTVVAETVSPSDELAKALDAQPIVTSGRKPAAKAKEEPKKPSEPEPVDDGGPVDLQTIAGLQVDVSEGIEKWGARRLEVGSKANPKNDALFGKHCEELLVSEDPKVDQQLQAMLARGLELQEQQGMAPRDPFGYGAILIAMRAARKANGAPASGAT